MVLSCGFALESEGAVVATEVFEGLEDAWDLADSCDLAELAVAVERVRVKPELDRAFEVCGSFIIRIEFDL